MVALAAALGLFAPVARGEGRPRLLAVFEDPAGDDTGPGSYRYPTDAEFTPGDFDLRRFAVYEDGDDLLFEVTLGSTFREPQTTQRTNTIPLRLLNGIYLQNIDVYVDTDPASPAGWNASIPGRRVAFADGRTWKGAVVITPQPGPASAITAKALGEEAASRIAFADGLVVRGRTVTARVPAYLFGASPSKKWGYSVQVSGARWERSFSALDLVRGGAEVNAFTMPVVGIRESWAFGGAPWGEVHPRVVDVLLPPGADQAAVLGSYDAAAGTFAKVPFVYGVLPPPVAEPVASQAAPVAPAVPVSPPVLRVADVSGTLVSISGPVDGRRPMQIGRVVGPDGATVARVVVVQVLEGGLVANAVEGRENVRPGAAVLFDGPAP